MRPVLSKATLVAGAAATLGLMLAGFFPLHNNDTFGHLAQGRQIVELGYVPAVDTFSFWRDTPQPWHNYEWGSDLVFWLVFSALGANGLLAMKSLVLGATATLLLRRAADARRTTDLSVLLTAALILWAIPAARFRLTMRPEMFGYLLGALYLVGLSRLTSESLDLRRRRRWVLGLVLAHVAWVNLHGSHLLGVALAGTHFVAVFRNAVLRRELGALLIGFGLVSCVSPYGPAIVTDAVVHVADPIYREVVREWAPWSEDDPVFYLVALVTQTLLVAVAAVPLFRGGPTSRAALATALLLSVVGFRSIRFVATFLLLSAPLVATGLAIPIRLHLRRRAPVFGGAAMLAGLFFAIWPTSVLPPEIGIGAGVDDRKLPSLAARVLEREMPGARVLAPMQTSWYLMYATPSARFLVDGRVPFYGPRHIGEVGRGLSMPGELEPLLMRYRVDALVLEITSSETQVALASLARIEGYYPVSIENDHVLFAAYLPGREAMVQARAFRALPVRLDPTPLLAVDAPVALFRDEIARLDRGPHTQAIRSWYEGVLSLRPLSRGEGAGFGAPNDEASRARAQRTERALGVAAAHYREVPIVHAYHALAAVAACRPDAVQAAAERSRRESTSREATFAVVEMALRDGDEAPARALLAEVERDPDLSGDPWLAALRRDVAARVRCP
jgi:hypothetical protein